MHFNATLELNDGAMGLYTGGATGTDQPAIIVLQEIFGVNASIRQMVDHYASHGFYASAPDLFWRQQAGIELDPNQDASHAAAVQAAQAYGKHPELAISDLAALLADLRKRHRKVGLVGYCLGGRMAFLSWLQLDLNAVVSYYGVGLDQLLNAVAAQSTPLQLHLGMSDQLIPAPAREAIATALQEKANVELHTYEQAGHAFARRGGKTLIPAAAKLADDRSLAFFNKNLKESL